MSCEFQLLATLEGISKFLDHGSNDSESEFDLSKNSFPDFKIALSPTGEIIVFAKKTWFLICGSKWDSSITDGAKIKYSPNCHGHVVCKPREEITSVLCLPFLSQGQSYQGFADWTCIIVGFSSGYIRFYTETMQELGCSMFHEEPITDIKCHCPITAQNKSQKQDSTDIYILYKTVICILNGSLLSQTLRNKRYQLAKSSSKNSETDSYMPLDFKKYGFVGQEEVFDAWFLGYGVGSSLNTFDHLVTASLIGGFNSNYRPSPPQTSLILTSGRKPFVGFHYTLEGGSSPVLSDVALAVASKIKNSVASTLPDWFGFGSKKPSDVDKPKEIALEPAEKLSCRFGLCDLWRQGQSVIVSPDGAFSAVSDSLGRVMLIDNSNGVAHRMWKGFRDAQCGFLQVQEDVRRIKRSKDSPKPIPRQGLFVVIYAPKKGLIEIFTTQHGRRVASFKVTKLGRLLYTPRHVGSNVSAGGQNLLQNQVVFISEEGLKEFTIPFHCALEEDNSRLSRDLHVLKKMKTLVKTESNASNPKVLEEIEKCAKELKTDEVRLLAIESMITYKNTTLEAFKIVVKIFLEDFQREDRSESPPKKIVAFANVTLNLLLFYEFLLNLNENAVEETPENSPNSETLSEELRLPEKELEITRKFISQIKEIEDIKKNTTKVVFEEKKTTKLGQYLSCFDFESFLNHLDKSEKVEEKKGTPSIRLNLKSSSKEQKLNYLGEVFFKGLFAAFSQVKQWTRLADSCFLEPSDLAFCLLSFWCSKKLPENYSSEVCFFVEILKSICSLNDPSVVSVEYNSESPWWSKLRSFVSTNPNTINALFAALVCRSVTIYIEQERELSCRDKKSKTSEGSSDASGCNTDWETISKDTCQWDILITQLEDVALLNAILNLNFKTQDKVSVLPKVPFDFEYQCLSSIQSSGTGRVAELVAKWLVQFGFEPNVLINENDLKFKGGGDGKENEKGKGELVEEFDKANEARGNDSNLNLALDYLALLKNRFPYSLSSNSLLCNMCWEYIAHWFKNVNEISYLESAVQYLEIIPSSRLKCGLSYLSWTTYLEKKFGILRILINKLERVSRGKLCAQETGLRNEQIPTFLRLVSEYLKIMLHADVEEKPDFGTNQEAIWQNKSTASTSSLVSIILSQPLANVDLIMIQLQVCYYLILKTGLNIKHSKIFSNHFDDVENTSLTSSQSQPPSQYQNLHLRNSRAEFLRKALSGAVQTVEEVEYIPPYPSDDASVSLPTTQLKVDEYKKWVQLCFELGTMWAVSLNDLRSHQICELYSNGFDRLAEEVIPSVKETSVLASQLLVIGGKRLKYLIVDSAGLAKKFSNLSTNLSDWLQTLDIDSFRCQCGSLDDIEVIMCYVVKWLPEGHSEQKLALSIIECLASLSPEET